MLLAVVGYLFWIIAYILIIKRGKQDQTYGLPFLTLLLNVSWEFTQTFVVPFAKSTSYPLFSGAWFGLVVILVLDIIISYQYLRFGITYDIRRGICQFSVAYYYFRYFILLLICLSVLIGLTFILHNYLISYVAAANFWGIIINVIDSSLFIRMLMQRNNLDGQSLYIAVAKMLGTLFSMLSLNDLFLTPFLLFPTLAVFILDWIYIFMIYRKGRSLNINLLKRF